MKRAFTLLEMFLVIALIGLLGAITIPFYQSLQINTQRETLSNELISSLHRAKLKAISAVDDQSWGVNLSQSQIIIFRGADFLNRDQNYDEIIEMPKNVSISGPVTEIVFNKFTGLPTASGTISVSDTTGKSQDITVTIQGTVDY